MPQSHPYFASTVTIVRRFETILPLLLMPVLLYFPASFVRGSTYPSTLLLELVCLLFLVFIMRLAFRQPPASIQLFITIALHTTMAIVTLIITGFYSPLTLFWLPLLLFASMQHGKTGLILSYLTLVSVAALDIIIESAIYSTSDAYFATVGIVLVVFGVIGFFLSQILAGVSATQEALHRSRVASAFEHQRVTTILESVSEAVIITDQAGIVRMHNDAAQALFEQRHSFAGSPLSRLTHLYDKAGTRVSIATLLKDIDEPQIYPHLHIRDKKGVDTPYELKVAPIAIPGKAITRPGYVVTLRRLNIVPDQVTERDEFIDIISHELRTPIAIAEASLSNMLRLPKKGVHVSDELQRQSAETAYRQIVFLANMVNDLAILSNNTSDTSTHTSRFSLDTLVHELYSTYQPQVASSGLELHLDVPARLPVITQNRLYIEEILQNFITNAIKYTSKGSITLEAKHAGDSIELALIDTGIGISIADQKAMFQKFYRAADNRTKTEIGSGLGLYIASKLAASINATIECQSKLNHGARFSLILPLQAADTTKAKARLTNGRPIR